MRRSGRIHHHIPVGRSGRFRQGGRIRLVPEERGSLAPRGGEAQAQCVGLLRHGRQRHGMGSRLERIVPQGYGDGLSRSGRSLGGARSSSQRRSVQLRIGESATLVALFHLCCVPFGKGRIRRLPLRARWVRSHLHERFRANSAGAACFHPAHRCRARAGCADGAAGVPQSQGRQRGPELDRFWRIKPSGPLSSRHGPGIPPNHFA